MTAAPIPAQEAGDVTHGALAGIRVIDLSRILGGPYCGQILGDHGADVLKVEPPQGDDTRTWGPPFKDGVASYYMGLNRNKLGTQLDLASEQGRSVLLGLLAGADVLVENFKTGTMEKWGLGYEQLAQRFPRLIHCRVSGFGSDGPLGGLAGYDAAVQALTGIMSVNGEVGGEPLRVGLPVVDLVTGLNAAIGVLLALQERERSGKGQFVEASLYDCGLSLLHPHAANWFADGREPKLTGNAHPNIYPTTLSRRTRHRSFWRLAMTSSSACFASTWACPSSPMTKTMRALVHVRRIGPPCARAWSLCSLRTMGPSWPGNSWRWACPVRRCCRSARHWTTRIRRTAAWWSRSGTATPASPRPSS